MLSKRKRIGIIIISLIITSFTTGYIIRGYSDDPNPTIDPTLGLYNFPWVNTSIGFNTHSVLIDGVDYTEEIKSYANYTTDHGEMTGLSDDDHNQYLFQDGSEEMAADWDAGSHGINASWFEASEFYLNSEDKTDIFEYPEQAASYLVFKSGSTTYAKNGKTGQIDYSNLNPATVFQNVLDNLPSGLNKVVVMGDFELNTQVTLSSNLIWELIGTISVADNFNNNLFVLTNLYNITIINGVYEGNYGQQTAGTVFYGNNMNNVLFKNLVINESRDQAIKISQNSYTVNVDNCKFTNFYKNGVAIQGGAGFTTKNVRLSYSYFENGCIGGTTYGDVFITYSNVTTVNNNVFNNSKAQAIKAENTVYDISIHDNFVYDSARSIVLGGASPFERVKIYNNHIIKSGAVGIQITSGTLSTINDISIYDNSIYYSDEHGIMYYGYYAKIYDNYIIDSGRGGGSAYGIMVKGNHTDIYGNTIKNPSGDILKGILLTDSSSADCNIFDNRVEDATTLISISGSADVWDNEGFVTENSGTTEASNDDWIAHGLAGEPDTVILTIEETDSNYFLQLKATTGTHFQIYLYDHTADVAETTDMTINWYAIYEP